MTIATLVVASLLAAPPAGRVLVDPAKITRGKSGSGFATLLPGMPVTRLKTDGHRVHVETRGPVQIKGWIPKRSVGLCASAQAPVSLTRGGNAIGFLPRGWCFRVQKQEEESVAMVDAGFGLTLWLEDRWLTDLPKRNKRFDAFIAGFGAYRIGAQPMRASATGETYFTVPAGEYKMRAPITEGDHAFIELLGEAVVLQGWERTTNLYADLFRKRSDVERAQKSLHENRRTGGKDSRQWFEVSKDASLYAEAGKLPVGKLMRGQHVTVNRRSGQWIQIRLESHNRRHKEIRPLDARLWIPTGSVRAIKNPFGD